MNRRIIPVCCYETFKTHLSHMKMKGIKDDKQNLRITIEKISAPRHVLSVYVQSYITFQTFKPAVVIKYFLSFLYIKKITSNKVWSDKNTSFLRHS